MHRPPLPTEPFTTATAASLGHDRKQLSRLVGEGVLRRPFTGVYLRAEVPMTMEVRARAARLVMSEHSVLCDRTAAWIWGVDVFGWAEHDVLPPLESYVLRHHEPTRRRDCHGGTRDLRPEDWCEVEGVRVTTPLRTALDLACNLRARDGLAAMDALARAHGFTREELSVLLRRYRRRRGVVQARRLVPLVDPRAESHPESWVREVLNSHGIEVPELQYWVDRDGLPTYRLDLAWPRARIAVEYDGVDHHTSPEDRARDEERRTWLREQGWYVIVLTKDSFSDLAVDAWVRDLRSALADRTRSRKRF